MALIPKFKGKTGSDKKYAALSLVKRDPKLAAIGNKAVYGKERTGFDHNGNKLNYHDNLHVFQSILQKRAKKNLDNRAITKLLPDIQLGAEILVSSILSPKDMTSVELIYNGSKTLLSPELSASMMNRMKEHFEEDYKIQDTISDMIKESLIEEGAYILAVIPENAIDEFINGTRKVSMEEMGVYFDNNNAPRNLQLLGNYKDDQGKEKRKYAINLEAKDLWVNQNKVEIDPHVHYLNLEDNKNVYSKEEYLTVTDNPNVLKLPRLNEKTKEAVVREIYQVKGKLPDSLKASLEDHALTDRDIEKAIYRNHIYKAEISTSLKAPNDLQRNTVGNPLIMRFPTESVMPVHVPGDVKKHLGYWILIDQEGNPVTANNHSHNGQGIDNASNNSLGSSLIRKVNQNLGNGTSIFDPVNVMHLNHMQKVYSDMVEKDLYSRLKNGIYSSNVSIARNEEVYRLMLSRVLSRKYTQLLFIPIEYMTYIAFNYTEDGIGRSLLDDLSMINTLRSVLLFSDVLGSMRNSVGQTKVNVHLDKEDPNPLKTFEIIQDEIVRSRSMNIPLSVTDPTDIINTISKAGIFFSAEGNDRIPDFNIETTQTNTGFNKADTSTTDELKNATAYGLNLSKDIIESGYNAQFAASVIADNILLAKRVIVLQNKFTPQLSDHLRKVAMHSEDLKNDLMSILESNFKSINLDIKDIDGNGAKHLDENIKKQIILHKAYKDFIDNFYVTLPRPTSSTVEANATELSAYADGLDKALDYFISSDMFVESNVGDISGEIGTIKSLLKAHFMRKWMAEKNIFTELTTITTSDEKGEPQIDLVESISTHTNKLVKAGVMSIIKSQAIKKAANADLKVNEVTPGDNSESGSSSDSGEGDNDAGGDGDIGGGDEPDFDGGAEGEAEPPDDGAEEPTDDKDDAEKDAGNADKQE